ncbi:MAG: hypothetical protein Q9P01_06780 [Anaerolineae bacterium]|nr:hypothetical protein [Anaerolineae bacterium]
MFYAGYAMPTQEAAREALKKLIDQYFNKDKDKALSESSVVQLYVEPLLEHVLGWPIRDSDRYLKEVHTAVGRPDLRLTAENDEVIYVEAKRFGVIEKLEKIEAPRYIAEIQRLESIRNMRMTDAIGPQQMALPSMAIDRTKEEQQAINYAFKNGGQWAILTNFERLRLFNARRDWLVLSFESPAAFLQDFDLLWEISYERILAGSLDYLSNQRYRENIDPNYLRLINTWRMELAQ